MSLSPPTPDQRSTVEDKVLEMVSETAKRTSELMKEAPEHDLSPADVREAVWTLLDDGRLNLTSDRRLTVP
jgi:hypothetical protein